MTVENRNYPDLFAAPIRSKKVRKGITAYQYHNGTINIAGTKYVLYSMTEAIRKFRKDFPAKKS